jgi:uncharacterized membrane protein YraQ (UPF0718 family)
MVETFNAIINWFQSFLTTCHIGWMWPGFAEAGKFIGEHLLSGMIPAFFIAGAIAIFIDKERITKYMGAKANPLVSYPVAALSGGILTVCSCGVIPIFTSIMQQGAGVGPAFTFLMSAPAVNLIALSYTGTLLGKEFLIGRTLAVFFSAIGIGVCMRFCYPDKIYEPIQSKYVIVEEEPNYTDSQLAFFFIILILVMLTTTGILDKYTVSVTSLIGVTSSFYSRLASVALEIIILALWSWKIFDKYEIKLWLKKSYQLFIMIFPKVLAGIFVCGIIGNIFMKDLYKFLSFFEQNTLSANIVSSIMGALMYFGTIVGVTIVSTLKNFGMHAGPSLALLLSGPAVSLPSILALIPIVGKKKAFTFLSFVMIFSALCGIIFGQFFN